MAIMSWINGVLTVVFDLLLWPFRSLHPLWALTVVSCLAGILMLWIFGKFTDQDKIHEVRDRIRGNLLGVRLFGDDLGLMFRLQGRILSQTLTYLRYALVAILITIVPLILILFQTNLRFSLRPLRAGESTTVKVAVGEEVDLREGVSLEVPEGIVLETPGVPADELNEVVWRVRAEQPGRHRLIVRANGEEVEKSLLVGQDWAPTSPVRTGRSFSDVLLYSGEKLIDSASAVKAIDVTYPELRMSLFGFNVNWLVYFFIVSIACGFALRKPLGVEI